MRLFQDTIVAIATPPGGGGVGIVRLSGPLAPAIAARLTQKSFTPRQALVCAFYDLQQQCIDTGVLLYFKAPHSFTGEEVIEFQCHGSPFILDNLIKACLACGARLANPGEFSLTAYLNGKIDLVQAEAIADLINATSEKSAQCALHALQGDFSKRIHHVKDALIQLQVLVEAMIDFPEEEIELSTFQQLYQRTTALLTLLDQLMRQTTQGILLREGVVVVIAGPPNAGKSTLMNALAGREVAIVTPIAGTTRDLMRETVLVDGVAMTLIDTAGLRETDCMIEQEGIKRAREAMARADLLLWVTEYAAPVFLTEPVAIPVITILNKMDGASSQVMPCEEAMLHASLKYGEGLTAIRQAILKTVAYQPEEGIFIARRRHLEALKDVQGYLNEVEGLLKRSETLELIAEALRLAQHALGSITGEFTSEALLGEIFSSFCIGK